MKRTNSHLVPVSHHALLPGSTAIIINSFVQPALTVGVGVAKPVSNDSAAALLDKLNSEKTTTMMFVSGEEEEDEQEAIS